MPKLLRPRQESPTPAFRAVIAIVAALLGVAPAALLLAPNGWVALPATAALISIPFVATRSRLARAAAIAVLALLVIDVIAYAIAFVTYPWD